MKKEEKPISKKPKKRTKKRKLYVFLLCLFLAVLIYLIVPVLRSPDTDSDSLSLSYETIYSEYLRETLLPQYGKADAGVYEYNRYGDTGEIQKARDQSGIVSVKIEDYDGNLVPEMLVISLVPGEESFEYSQVEAELYGYDKKTEKVELLRRLTDAFRYMEGETQSEVRPLIVSGMEDEIRIFYKGDYFCMESTAAGEKSTRTITLFEKRKLIKDPGVMIRAEQKEGRPMAYTLYRPGESAEELSQKSGKESEYLEEFLGGNETPVSEEALLWLTSSIGGAEKALRDMGVSPRWEENPSFVWVDGRTGVYSVFDGSVRQLTTYINHLEEGAEGPNQPAVQTIRDGTAFQKKYDLKK